MLQQTEPCGLERIIAIDKSDPLFVLGETCIFNLTQCCTPFLHLRKQDGNLLSRDVEVEFRNIPRRFGLSYLPVKALRIERYAVSRTLQFDAETCCIAFAWRQVGREGLQISELK